MGFLSTTAIPGFDSGGALATSAQAIGIEYDGDCPRHPALGGCASWSHSIAGHGEASDLRAQRRANLRVGLAFNMKRIDSHGDDREAEYDALETIQAITVAIESHAGHAVVPLEATQEFPRALIASERRCCLQHRRGDERP